MNPPLVTILVPCRNPMPFFFREALRSVFLQSSSSWKLILIPDSFNDLSELNILSEWMNAKEKRISVIKNASKLITGALNTGMRHVRSPYVCSLLCDDLLDNKTIEVLDRYINEYPDIDFFHSSRMYIDESGKPISSIYRARESFKPSDFKNSGPVKHLMCWKVQSALSIGGMDESLGFHGADDYDFPWCMAEAGFSFKAIPECLYYYRDHREHYRLTTHVPLQKQINELKKILRKHGLNDREIEDQIERRKSKYLKQAVYLDDEDKEDKESMNYDIKSGWRQKYF